VIIGRSYECNGSAGGTQNGRRCRERRQRRPTAFRRQVRLTVARPPKVDVTVTDEGFVATVAVST